MMLNRKSPSGRVAVLFGLEDTEAAFSISVLTGDVATF